VSDKPCPVCKKLLRRWESRDDGLHFWHAGPHILGDTSCWLSMPYADEWLLPVPVERGQR